MNSRVWLISIALMLTASGASAQLAQAVLSPQGLGSLTIGMTVDQARRHAKEPIVLEESSDKAACVLGDLTNHPGLGVLVENGKIKRITATAAMDEESKLFITPGDYVTVEGIRLGDDEAKIKKTYKKSVTVEPHIYDDNGHYLKVKQPDGFGYMFETHDGKVIDIHAGEYPAVGYSEGCL